MLVPKLVSPRGRAGGVFRRVSTLADRSCSGPVGNRVNVRLARACRRRGDRLGLAYEVIPMRMNLIAFVSFIAVAMIAGAAEAGKPSGIKTTNEIVNYRAGGNPISIRKPPGPKVGRSVPLRRGTVGTFKWP